MKRRILLVCCVLGALLLTWCLRTGYIVSYDPARAFLKSAPAQTQRPTASPAGATPAPTLSPEEQLMEQADGDFMKNRVNILLVGFDESPERDEEDSRLYRDQKNNFRSDVLLMMAVNFEKGTVHLISIPRDTYTPIYRTKGRWKINAAFAKGGAAEGEGFAYAMNTVEMLLGVPVEYYAGVNMAGMKKLVDAMGGVDYDVDVEIRLNGRVLEKGFQHLSGQQVLDYCRARKGISTDVGRTERQQRMLLAIFRELKKENLLTALPSLYNAVKGDLYTNLEVSQVAALASFALGLDDASFKRTTLSGEYVSNVYHASYYVLENKKLVRLIREEFGISIKRDGKYDLSRVKRDKAAAEAKKAAEALEEVAAMVVIPADTTGSYAYGLLAEARAAASQLLYAIDCGVEEREIRRLQEILMGDAARLLRETDLQGGVPEAFRSLTE